MKLHPIERRECPTRWPLQLGVMVIALFLAAPAGAQDCGDPHPTPGGVNRWPRGIVPYVFDSTFPEQGKAAFRAAVIEWMRSGGAVAFVEYLGYDSPEPYLVIKPSSGKNSATVGPYSPGYANIDPTIKAGQHSHILHELGHVLGFYHEQSRPDRDLFVSVQHQNIRSSEAHNFTLHPWECWPPGTALTGYDYASIMHYDWCLGSRLGCGSAEKGVDDTMFTTDPSWQYNTGRWVANLGDGLTTGDKFRIKVTYGAALWVDSASDCLGEDGSFDCNGLNFDFHGPYKTVASALNAAPASTLPLPTLMILPGTYQRGTAGTLRVTKSMKWVAPTGGVKIQ